MVYVLVIITVFSNFQGIATATRFHEFASEAACEAARADIERAVRGIKGTLGREIVAACYAKGEP